MLGFDFRFGFQVQILGLDSRLGFQVWILGLDLRFGSQVWISGSDFRFQISSYRFQVSDLKAQISELRLGEPREADGGTGASPETFHSNLRCPLRTLQVQKPSQGKTQRLNLFDTQKYQIFPAPTPAESLPLCNLCLAVNCQPRYRGKALSTERARIFHILVQ